MYIAVAQLLAIIAVECSQARFQAVAPPKLELSAEQLGAIPFPCQAVRVRIQLSNNSDNEIKDVFLVESGCCLIAIKTPGNQNYQPVGKLQGDQWQYLRPRFGYTATRYDKYVNQKLTIQSQGSMTISTAFIGMATRDSFGLFLQSGEHGLQFGWMQKLILGYDLLAKPLTISVKKPEGDECDIVAMLQKDAKTSEDYFMSLIYRMAPSRPETIGILDTILTKHPKSSFVDYAHFLIALNHAQGTMDNRKQRVVTDAQKRAAMLHLEAINYKAFPYAPDALLLLRRLIRDDAARVKRIDAGLQTNFRDAIEWLEEQAADNVPFEKITQNRKAPAQPKPDPKKP